MCHCQELSFDIDWLPLLDNNEFTHITQTLHICIVVDPSYKVSQTVTVFNFQKLGKLY